MFSGFLSFDVAAFLHVDGLLRVNAAVSVAVYVSRSTGFMVFWLAGSLEFLVAGFLEFLDLLLLLFVWFWWPLTLKTIPVTSLL